MRWLAEDVDVPIRVMMSAATDLVVQGKLFTSSNACKQKPCCSSRTINPKATLSALEVPGRHGRPNRFGSVASL